MKRIVAFYGLLAGTLLSAPVQAHPGHGAPGLWHHAPELGLWALLAIAFVAVVVTVARRHSKR